ncbi:MAG TPA: hypothetical protein VN452_05365 [Longilinea sp.]|nr:hypothetical protein [Longilinea sp.]
MKPERDLRRFASGTTFRLVGGGLAILFIVGLTLIAIIYGKNAALLGFVCLLAGLGPIILIYFFLRILDWISKRD